MRTGVRWADKERPGRRCKRPRAWPNPDKEGTTVTKVTPLILRDYEHEMPDWVYDVLTPSQADEDRTSALWRWQALIAASDLPGPAKAVALWLKWHCKSREFVCYPSVGALASESGFARKTVERAIQILEQRGYLYVWREKYSKTDKRRRVNRYAPAWPMENISATEVPRCGEIGHRGKPCQRPAAWGVQDAVDGPCKFHLEDTDDNCGQEMPYVGQEMPYMLAGGALRRRAGESPVGSSSCSKSGLHEHVARPKMTSDASFSKDFSEDEELDHLAGGWYAEDLADFLA